jgi:hypothetical protein
VNARRAVAIVALTVLTTSGMAPAQAPERGTQMGIKTTGRGWVLMADVTVSMDGLPMAGQAVQGASGRLWTDALAAGVCAASALSLVIATVSARHSAVALAFSPLPLGRRGGRWERGLGVRAPWPQSLARSV